ncbi:hypothetical protein GBF38_021987 [Nibea albiflora]|uniref:Uncharacterized protein n=1 Tax=Nibea albiflora TaxID=240163 RepID=A0ACB7FGB2_NIBAL|nr:hypothetical protein GBF38_021987 [Nibea albiflora]
MGHRYSPFTVITKGGSTRTVLQYLTLQLAAFHGRQIGSYCSPPDYLSHFIRGIIFSDIRSYFVGWHRLHFGPLGRFQGLEQGNVDREQHQNVHQYRIQARSRRSQPQKKPKSRKRRTEENKKSLQMREQTVTDGVADITGPLSLPTPTPLYPKNHGEPHLSASTVAMATGKPLSVLLCRQPAGVSRALTLQQSDSFSSLPRDDGDLRAKLCCGAMGRGQKTRSPTVPVSQLSEARRATTRATGALNGTPCFTGQWEENQSRPLQAVQVEGL